MKQGHVRFDLPSPACRRPAGTSSAEHVCFSSHRRLTLSSYLINAVGVEYQFSHVAHDLQLHGPVCNADAMPPAGLASEEETMC